MTLNLDALPAELLRRKNVVLWRYEQRDGEKKPTKVPVNPRTGQLASVADSKTWSDGETALAAADKFHCDGAGVVLTAEDGLTGFDSAACIDPAAAEIDPSAAP